MAPEFQALTRIHAYVIGLSKDEPEALEDDFQLLRHSLVKVNREMLDALILAREYVEGEYLANKKSGYQTETFEAGEVLYKLNKVIKES